MENESIISLGGTILSAYKKMCFSFLPPSSPFFVFLNCQVLIHSTVRKGHKLKPKQANGDYKVANFIKRTKKNTPVFCVKDVCLCLSIYGKDTEPLYHSFMYHLYHFFTVFSHYLQCIHCLLQ